MKSSVLAIATIVIALVSCDEIPPNIDLSPPYVSKDTTYINSTVPAKQHKAVLIEDITGVRCVNCPQAAEEARKIVENKTEDSVVVMGVYTKHMPTLTTPYAGYIDLRSDLSTTLVDYLGVPGDLPKGYVDRKIFAPLTERFVQYKSWSNYTEQQLKMSTPVNITLSSVMNGKIATLTMKLEYTENVNISHNYALYIIEDDIVSYQLGGDPNPDQYVHKHVLRASIGSSTGSPLNASLVPGRTFQKILDYEVPSNFNADKMRLVCVITNGSTKEVVNVREIHLR